MLRPVLLATLGALTSALACTSRTAELSTTSGISASSSSTSGGGTSSGSTGGVSAGGTSGSTGSPSSNTGGSSTTGGLPTSSSSGGTTGSCTSSAGDAGCLPTPDGGLSPYLDDNCTSSSDCCCLTCVFSQGTGSCEPDCNVGADCPLAYTSCRNGKCTVTYCGGEAGGSFNGPCDLDDAGDGTCTAPGGLTAVLTDAGYWLGFCAKNGTAATGASCDGTYRMDPSQLCVPGDVCTFAASGNLICTPACDASAPDAGCPAGLTCQPYFEGGDQFTACL
jgi:hypothetical protein